MEPFIGNAVLIVIDLQQDGYLSTEEAGIPRMDGFAGIVARTTAVVAAARQADVPIIFTQEVHRPSGIDIGRELDGAETMHCVEGVPGTELVDELCPRGEREFLVQKRRYSAFYLTELELLLRALRAETLIIAGGLTDVCVHLTAADAHQRDFHIRVLEDCVIGSSPAAHAAALAALAYLQRDALVGSAEAIAALAGRVAEVV
jgi:nicotinamidase-related amidase